MFDFIKKKEKQPEADADRKKIVAAVKGKMFSLEEVNDPVFSGKMLGDGIAFAPIEDCGVVVSPVSGKLTYLYPTGHAFIVTTADDVNVLVHIGIDTVKAGGGFEIFVKAEQEIKAGDPIVKADFKRLQQDYDTSVMLIITGDDPKDVRFFKDGTVECGETIGEIL